MSQNLQFLIKDPLRYSIFALIVVLLCFLAMKFGPLFLPVVFIIAYIWIAYDRVSSNNVLASTRIISNVDNTITENMSEKKSSDMQKCSVCAVSNSSPSSSGKLLPIMNPAFNLRETAKHLILLEDHLFHKGKRCPDCILKHCYTIDAFLDEAITLDKEMKYNKVSVEAQDNFVKISKKIEEGVQNKTLDNDKCCLYAQELRKIRKPLVQITANMQLD